MRLAFLDVLQERRTGASPPPPGWATPARSSSAPAGYVPVAEPGPNGWLRRYSGVLGLFAVLLMCLLVGLLVGHWVTQSNKAPGKQVVEVKGLAGLGSSRRRDPGQHRVQRPPSTPAETQSERQGRSRRIQGSGQRNES